MKYLKSVNYYIKVYFEEFKFLYVIILKGWVIEILVIVFIFFLLKFECCILFKIIKKNYYYLRFNSKWKFKNLFRKFRKLKVLFVKVSIYLEESVSVEVYVEIIGLV